MSWPMSNRSDSGVVFEDRPGAEILLAQAIHDGLLSNNVDVDSTTIQYGQPIVNLPLRTEEDFTDHIKLNLATPYTSNILYLFQQHSRAPIDLTPAGLNALLVKLEAFPALAGLFQAFVPEETDCYLGRANVHFKSTRTGVLSTSPASELCALLKYITRNTRDSKGLKSNAWSIRNLGFYQKHNTRTNSEAILLINVSEALGIRMKQVFKGRPGDYRPYKHWTHMPLLVVSTLAANWSSFTTDLHEEVTQLTSDSAFTDPSRTQIGEINMQSLEKCTTLLDLLQHATHALQTNIDTLKAMQEQSRKLRGPITNRIGVDVFEQEYEDFEHGVGETMRELSFTRDQLRLVQSRLNRTMAAIRDLISLRSTHTIERLTMRSMVEARTVRLIAIVSLLFIPPTFTTVSLLLRAFSLTEVMRLLMDGAQSFIQADMVHPFSSSRKGLLQLNADLDLWFWLAITIPLMLVTLGGWLYWDWRTTRKMSRELDWKV